MPRNSRIPLGFSGRKADAAIGQDFYQMGYQSVSLLHKLINGEAVEAEYNEELKAKFIGTGGEIATWENWKEVLGVKE